MKDSCARIVELIGDDGYFCIMTILVTGGAGYIGSHVVRQLGERHETVIVLDTLGSGFRSAVVHGELVVGDTGDRELVARLLRERGVDTVMHFAANTVVPESVTNPLKYYGNNTCATRNLLQCCQEAGVKHFVFSSTAAVYGIPAGGVAAEDSPTAPINPYGTSKLMSEWMLRDVGAATALRYVVLRYFNVAGSDPGGRIGQSTLNGTLLTKVACEVAVGKRPHVAIFGTDYPTPDGTGVRDYIHVEDLAAAHLKALDYLSRGGASTTLNCGYGHGYSVREVIAMVERLNGRPLPTLEQPRRAGDPPSLIARAERVRQVLGWSPQHDNLEAIVRSQLEWERRLQREPQLQRNF
jgi:UDP-glucose 4-epimerase